MVDRLEAAEVVVVLVEAADDAFDGVVGGWDQVAGDAIDERGPVACEEGEDDGGIWGGLAVVMLQGKHRGPASFGEGARLGGKDGVDLLFEGGGWVVLEVVWAVDVLEKTLNLLEGMKNTQ